MIVAGITCDAVYSLKAWADQLGVTYALLSDYWPHGAVSRAYGIFNEEVGRPDRSVFLVDAAGAVRYIDVHQLREVPDETEIAEELEKLG